MFPIVIAAFYKVNNSAQVFECLLLQSSCYFPGFFKSNYANLWKIMSYFGFVLHLAKNSSSSHFLVAHLCILFRDMSLKSFGHLLIRLFVFS